jgi:hypothetical protein
MKIVDTTISLKELNVMAEKMFNNIVKAVIDVEQEIVIVDAMLHSDQEEYLLDVGSLQANLWGVNLHPDKFGIPEFIEFDSMINLRPNDGNRSRGVDDPRIQEKIRVIIAKKVAL